jgi:dihydroorotate dehydrogenase electron transfer subunit
MPDETVTVLENGRVNGRYHKLAFRSKPLSRKVLPGQFIEIKVREGWDPLLRRPMSYYRITGERVEILYEVHGRGTQLLSKLQKGETLRVLGPLGREFSGRIEAKKRILVGGGVGVPPLVFLAERYGCHRFFIGTKSRKEVLPTREIRKFRAQVFYTTEDGSYGEKGLVTELLEELFEKEKGDPQDYFIQTCGPNRMMQRVLEIASHYGIEGEASWDERMACGIGVCLGCTVWTHKGWLPSCTEGPVFRFDEMAEGHLWTAE